jgi:hypothetical protein
MTVLKHGDRAAQLVSQRVAAPIATVAALKAIKSDKCANGQVAHVTADDTLWQYNTSSAVTGDDLLAITPGDSPSTGRWMRMPGAAMIAMTFYATTPTGTNLLTVPSNTILQPLDFGLKVTRVFTGPSNAAIAVSSTNHPGHTGVGGFMGSAVATLLNNVFSATAAGTGCDFQMGPVASGTFNTLENKRAWMKGGDTVRLDVIGAAFGTGVGQVLMACNILRNPGA